MKISVGIQGCFRLFSGVFQNVLDTFRCLLDKTSDIFQMIAADYSDGLLLLLLSTEVCKLVVLRRM